MEDGSAMIKVLYEDNHLLCVEKPVNVPVQPDGSVYGETAYEQARYIFDKMLVLLAQAGAGARDVYRVDYFVTDMANAAEVGRAYSETFHNVKPLCTGMAIKSLNRPTQLVEIELAAMVHTVLE